MKVHDVYPSQWLSAADIPDGGIVVTVRGVSLAEVGRDKDSKPVLSFEELDKGLILNKTNWNNMVVLTKKDDSDNWPGFNVELYATKVQFGSDEVDAVRIRQPKSKPKPAPAAPPTPPANYVEKFAADVVALGLPEKGAQLTARINETGKGQFGDTWPAEGWRKASETQLAAVLAALANDFPPF